MVGGHVVQESRHENLSSTYERRDTALVLDGHIRGRSVWWSVFAAVMGLIVGNGPVMQFSFGVFLKPLVEELKSDRATVSTALLVGLVFTGVCTPVAGRLVDRFGVRGVALTAIPLLSLAMASLALIPANLGAFIAAYAVAGIVAAGQTPLPYAKAVAGAFERRRGLALGIAMAGVGLGTAIVPQIAQLLIGSVGWRSAYVGLGAFTFTCAFPAVFFFLGEPVPLAQTVREQIPGVTTREAFRSSHFWWLAAIFFAVAAAAAGTIAHVVPILTDHGVAPQVATAAVSFAGIALIAGRLVAGYLLDRVFAPYVAFVLFLVPLAGICLLFFATTSPIAIAATTCVGIGLGAEVDLIAMLTSRYLGMRCFGEIYGYLFAVFMLGSGLGPFLMSLSFTRTGSYGTAIVGLGLGLIVACCLILLFGAYRYPATEIPGSRN